MLWIFFSSLFRFYLFTQIFFFAKGNENISNTKLNYTPKNYCCEFSKLIFRVNYYVVNTADSIYREKTAQKHISRKVMENFYRTMKNLLKNPLPFAPMFEYKLRSLLDEGRKLFCYWVCARAREERNYSMLTQGPAIKQWSWMLKENDEQSYSI